MSFPIPKLPAATEPTKPLPRAATTDGSDNPILQYSPKAGALFFATSNPNAGKIHGISRTLVNGQLYYVIPRFYPANMFALKDFKALFPQGKASPEAGKAIARIKQTPTDIGNLVLLDSLEGQFWKTFPPKMHQLKAMEAMLHMQYLAILADPGLGKTYIALNFLEVHERGKSAALLRADAGRILSRLSGHADARSAQAGKGPHAADGDGWRD